MTVPRPRHCVFLDRDGVLIRSDVRNGLPIAVNDPDRVELLPDVMEACEALRRAGFLLVMVTNQPDVAKGIVPAAVVEAINDAVATKLGLHAIRACFHTDEQDCGCRKPKPGMLLDAAREFGIETHGSFMVGDRWRDIEAGRRAGCRTVHVCGGHDEPLRDPPDFAARSLADATTWILTFATT